ncbi:polysaccharide pyruvyl transferase family protein [Streptomyces aidingensis]|uniref:Polysaccharide pyruvyl transferase n=1 Tax=Streptomyces aidingensis TaxID=910347 RepID=A0A1I1L8A6_9ACTN|nr:polysaccharide pyruvyl transferase family protein [Streptomyces aidingensis]SFC69344.1 Polysaccharide pyruvyl transferase [Streptomyces aidingensis]
MTFQETAARQPGRVLLTGWFSFLHGEATAGDVLALRRVQQVLDRAGVRYDVAWSPRFRPDGLSLDETRPERYASLVFVCGPLHGPRIAGLHERFPHCLRIAVGTSVIDPEDPAVTGFHRVLARDGRHIPATRDLAVRAPTAGSVPVTGVILTRGQGEYGTARLHDQVARTVSGWLARTRCAPVVLDTRLDARDGLLAGTPEELLSLLERTNAVITDRLHGMVLALRAGVPPIAVDPVRGGAKVSAQADACRWPALIPAERLDFGRLDAWWSWCLRRGRQAALRRGRLLSAGSDPADQLLGALRHAAPALGR